MTKLLQFLFKNKLKTALLIISIIIIIIVAIADLYRPIIYQGNVLPGQIGRTEGKSRIAEEGKDKYGFLTYGPYVLLSPGEYKIQLEYSASSAESGSWDIIYTREPHWIIGENLPLRENGSISHKITVSKEDIGKTLEIRTKYSGKGTLKVSKIVIKKYITTNAVLLRSLTGMVVGTMLVLLLFMIIQSRESRLEIIKEEQITDISLIVLIISFLIVFYPFDFGMGIFKTILYLALIYTYLIITGMGIYFLLTPEFLRRPPMIYYLTAGYGLLLLSIINIYVINMNMDIIYSFYISLIVATATLTLSFVFKKEDIISEVEKLKQINAETIRELLIVVILLFIVLSPILRSNITTTPYRLDIDQSGYAGAAQFLLSGGTIEQAEKELLYQIGTQDFYEALKNYSTALLFNSTITTGFLLMMGATGIMGILATFAFIVGADHVYSIQFLALSINYMILFGFILYVLRYYLNCSKNTSSLLSLALVLNCNLLNVYYEGMNAQLFNTPFLFILIIGYLNLRQKNVFHNLKTDFNQIFAKGNGQYIFFLAFMIAGVTSIYYPWFLVFLVFVVLSVILDFISFKGIRYSSIKYLSLSICLGLIMIFPHVIQLFYYFLGNLQQLINISGFWQPHWASPAEILGILNMYTHEYTQNAPRLLERGEMDFFINFLLSIIIIFFIFSFIIKKRDFDKSFWLAAPLFVLAVFIKIYFLDQIHNYSYMKAYTIILPFLLIVSYMAIDFHCKTNSSILNRVSSIMKYIMIFSIIFNGILFIRQYNQEKKVITEDMFKIYEFNKNNNNIFNSYVLIANKEGMDEFMIVPMIPFNWLNLGCPIAAGDSCSEGIYKNPQPHMEKGVAFFLKKKDFNDQSFLNKYRNHVIYENPSFLIIDTQRLLKDSYDPSSKKCDYKLYIKDYSDIFN